MDDLKLKRAWQQMDTMQEMVGFQAINNTKKMEYDLQLFESRISSRDRREIIVAIACLCFFIVLAVITDGYRRIGSVLLGMYCIWVIYYLMNAKAKQPGLMISSSIKEQLIQYLLYVKIQRDLVKNVLYWYILPIVPGLLFIYLSMSSWLAFSLGLLISLSVLFYVFRLNRKAAKENYDHLIAELQQAIDTLEP